MTSLLLLSSYVEEVVAGYAVGSISLILIGYHYCLSSIVFKSGLLKSMRICRT